MKPGLIATTILLAANLALAQESSRETKAPATHEEAIRQGIARIDAELKQYGGGTWEGWAKALDPFRESLKANRPPTQNFRFSREGRVMLLADRLQEIPECARAFDAIVHASRQFKKIGIDLMVVIIPNKIAVYPDFAADGAPEHRMVMLAEKRFCRELLEKDVEVVDLYTAFRDFRQKHGDRVPLYYGSDDIHWRNAGARVAAEEIAGHLKRYPFVREALAQPKRFVVKPDKRTGRTPDMVDYIFKADGSGPYADVYDSPVMLTGDSYSRYNWRTEATEPQGHFAAQVGLRINLPLTYIAGSGLWDDMPAMVSGIDLGRQQKYPGNKGFLKHTRVIVWTFVARAMQSGRPWKPFDLPQAAGE